MEEKLTRRSQISEHARAEQRDGRRHPLVTAEHLGPLLGKERLGRLEQRRRRREALVERLACRECICQTQAPVVAAKLLLTGKEGRRSQAEDLRGAHAGAGALGVEQPGGRGGAHDGCGFGLVIISAVLLLMR